MVFNPYNPAFTDPTPIEESAHRSWLSRVADSFRIGRATNVASIGIYDALESGEGLDDALKVYDEVQQRQLNNEEEGNFLLDLIYKGANTVGQMIDVIKKSGVRAALGGVAGGIVGGIAGLLIPTVGEEGFLVAGGAKLGAELAGAETAALYSYRASRGQLYASMIKEGVDPDIAKGPVNQVASAMMSILEVASLGLLAAPFKKALTKPASELLAQGVAAAAGKAALSYGKTLAGEVTEEALQEVVQIIAEDVAKTKTGIDIGSDDLNDFLYTRTMRVLETGKNAIESFALLPIPGAALEGAVGLSIHQSNLPLNQKYIDDTIQLVQDSKLNDEEKAGLIEQVQELGKEALKVEVNHTTQVNAVNSGIDKITEIANKYDGLYKKQSKKISQERAKRFSAIKDIRKEKGSPWVAYYRSLKEAKGQIKEQEFIPFIEDGMTQMEADSMVDIVKNSSWLNEGEYLQAMNGLKNLIGYKRDGKILGGLLPADKELKLLNRVFGEKFTRSILDMKKNIKGQSRWQSFLDAANLSRTLMVSGDLSGPGRQALLLLPIAPKQWIKGAYSGIKAFQNEKFLRLKEIRRKTNPNYQRLKAKGLKESQIGALLEGEEYFGNPIADRFPLVRRSESAFVGSLNEVRWGTAYRIMEKRNLSDSEVEWLVSFLNHATGHGDIKALERFMPALSTFMFAPRYVFGQLQAVQDLFGPVGLAKSLIQDKSPLRLIMAGKMVAALASSIGLLGILNSRPGVEVEDDPRSTDFGKIKVGNTRINIFGGYQPMARTLFQVMTQEVKTNTGKIIKKDWNDTVTRFLQSKLSPVGGFITTMLSGQTYMGEQVTLSQEDLEREFYTNFTPLFAQDVIDAVRFQGLSTAAWSAPLAVQGIGVQTYKPRPYSQLATARNQFASQSFGKYWDDLSPIEQQTLKLGYPVLEQLERQKNFEREDYGFQAKIAEEQAKIGKKIRKKLPKNIQRELDILQVRVPGLSRSIADGWYLNDVRYQQYQMAVDQQLAKILPMYINQPGWKTMPVNIRQKMLESIFRKTYSAARQQIVGQANADSFKRRSEI